MAIFRYDAPVEIIGAQYNPDNQLSVKYKLLEPFGDGSGKQGDISTVTLFEDALTADSGPAEIYKACERFTQLKGKEAEMLSNISNIQNKSISELTGMYNKMVPEGKRISKFRSREAALSRLTDFFAGNSKKTRKAKAPSPEQRAKFLGTILKAKEPVAVQGKVTTDDGKKIKLDLHITENPEQKSSKDITLVGKKSSLTGKYLYKTVDKNPRRQGTHGWMSWNCLRSGMTYEQFIAAHGGNKHLQWDIKKGHIEVRSKPKEKAS